jgi:outer membrane protein assembly factor BamB
VRRCALALLVGCAPSEAKIDAPPPVVQWVYAPPPVALLGEPRARLGRSQAPQDTAGLGIAGALNVPLRSATPWAVPGDKARAIVYGLEGAQSAIELIELDEGRVVWRDTKACAGPVVGVTEHAVVCADANGPRGVGMDGKAKWKMEAAYLAMTEERVVVEGAGEVIVLDADTGDELARVKLPKTMTSDAVIASCGDAGRELFAQGQDGKLVRIAEAKGGPAITWAAPIGKIDELDACSGSGLLVREAGTLIAIDRATGKVTGRVEGVLGHWRSRDGSEHVEVSTRGGLATWPRDLLGTPTVTSSIVLGELLAEHGDRRLVRATARTAVVLDQRGVLAYVPFAMAGAVLGETAILGASWSDASSVRRFAIPSRYRKVLRLAPERPGVALPVELRDLPAPEAIDAAIEESDAGKHAVLAIALDATESSVLYTMQIEKADEESNTPSIAAFDLAKRRVLWTRDCGTGESVGLAAARDAIVCATQTRTSPSAIVRATNRSGAAKWEWKTERVDRIAAAGDVVLAFDADRVTILDAASGKPRWRITSDDGAPVRAAAIAAGARTIVVAYEHGRVTARLPGGFPLWSIVVDGIVASIAASADGALVALEDGDAYRVALDGTIAAMPGLNLEWRAAGDVVAATTAGGPIPGTPLPPAKPLRVLQPWLQRRLPPPPPEEAERPRMWTPIPPPPPLGDSWQLTLYELAGGLRARNDYGLFAPIAPARERGPAGSPIVVASGPGLREVLVIDPRDGDPMRRVQLSEDAAGGHVFGTIVDGTPVAGAVLQNPLRVVIF